MSWGFTVKDVTSRADLRNRLPAERESFVAGLRNASDEFIAEVTEQSNLAAGAAELLVAELLIAELPAERYAVSVSLSGHVGPPGHATVSVAVTSYPAEDAE